MQENLSTKMYHWLEQALLSWQQDNIISESQAAQITARYQMRNVPLFSILMTVLAAVLIGGGVILLIAHNWKFLSQPVRAGLSFLPLLVSQGLLWWCYKKSIPAREGSAIFHALALGASISLISQTYHSDGTLAQFLTFWLILLMPIVLLYPAQSGHIAALTIGTFYVFAMHVDYNGHLSLALTVLVVFALPAWREKNHFTRWAYWIYISTLLTRLIFNYYTQEIEFFAFLSVLFYLFGSLLHPQLSYFKNPARFFGAMGVFLYTVFFCFASGNSEFYEYYLRDYFLFHWQVLLLLVAALMFVAFWKKRLHWQRIAYASLPLLIIFFFLYISHQSVKETGASPVAIALPLYWLLMGYILIVGIMLSIQAESQGRWGKMNAGLLLVFAVVCARFFDAEQSFLLRGMIFIAVGTVLLGFNIWYMKKRRKA